MASVTISLPDPMLDHMRDRIDSGHYANASDYVRDLIRRDHDAIDDERRWLQDLDASIADSLAEMQACRGVDLDTACDAALAAIDATDSPSRP